MYIVKDLLLLKRFLGILNLQNVAGRCEVKAAAYPAFEDTEE